MDDESRAGQISDAIAIKRSTAHTAASLHPQPGGKPLGRGNPKLEIGNSKWKKANIEHRTSNFQR
jgi:hypothetical protein